MPLSGLVAYLVGWGFLMLLWPVLEFKLCTPLALSPWPVRLVFA